MSEDINRKIDGMLADMRAPFPSKEESWNRLMLRIEAEAPVRQKSSWKRFLAPVAAGLAITIGLFVFNDSAPTQIETLASQVETVRLPDGSVVTLGAMSSLSYDADDFLSSRTLELDGEAFFQVQKGSRFQVQTDQGTIAVLGTSFNILDRKELLEVSCETGKVSVTDDNGSVILTPGKATDNKAGQLSDPYASSGAQDWIKGLFDFQEDDLSFVFDEIERQFGVSIQRPQMDGMLFTGEFDSSDLETALTVICQPMGMEYQVNDNSQIVVTLK